MPVSIEDLIGSAKPPVRSVTICMDQSMQAEHDELRERLDQLSREQPSKMGDSSEARQVAAQIRQLEDDMQERLQTFHFQGLSKNALASLYKRFPPAKDSGALWDPDAGGHALVAASAIDPVMTEDQAKRLFDVLSDGQSTLLASVAWLASKQSAQIPFSARASELTGNTGSN